MAPQTISGAFLAVAFLTLSNAVASESSDLEGHSLERSLARLVNVHALPLHMIVGTQTDRGCTLSLDQDFRRASEKLIADAQARIYRELELSNIQRDIRRFNAPRSPSDEALFKVDLGTCTPIEYRPQISEFKPPSRNIGGKLTVTYETLPVLDSGIEVDVVVDKQRHTVNVVREAARSTGASVLDLSAPAKYVAIGDEDLILKWGNQVLVDWSLGRWPLLRSAVADKNIRLRVRAGASLQDSGEARTAAAGSRMAFPEGAVLTVLRFNRNGIPMPSAQVSWRQVRKSQVLYSRDSIGRDFWGRAPSNFEAQIIQSLRSGPKSTDTPVTLTLRPELNDQLSRALLTAAGSNDSRWWEVYGSVVLMDATSGSYIAAAGVPVAPRPRSLPNEPFLADDHFREEFLRRRTIGSVAKAPISHAIIASTPALAGLTLKPYPAGPQRSIVGIPLEKPFDEHGNSNCGGKADFECFLKNSLNRYAATLLTLAAIPQLDRGDLASSFKGSKPLGVDAFLISNPDSQITVANQPSSMLWLRTPTAEQLLGLPWVRYAKSQYDIDVSLSANTGIMPLDVHGYMWRHAFSSGNVADVRSVQMIAPERENLRLDQARSLRSNYLPLVLGGGESLWSSAKVAEVFARTVTGNRIMGSFVRAGRATNWERLKDVDNADVALARQRYLEGLQGVFISGTGSRVFGGKVKALKERARSMGLELKVYAKSGTPSIDGKEVDDSDDEDEYLDPIDRAYRLGLLSAVPSAGRLQVYLQGQLIDSDLLVRLQSKGNRSGLPAPLALRHLRYLVSFNAMDRERQGLMCQVKGGSFQCSLSPLEFRKDDGSSNPTRRYHRGTGRNYAVYAELSDPATGKVCRAISMAVSFSEKGAPFNNLMNHLLKPTDAPLTRALGLDDPRQSHRLCGEAS